MFQMHARGYDDKQEVSTTVETQMSTASRFKWVETWRNHDPSLPTKGVPLVFLFGKSRLARQRGWRSTSSQEPSALINKNSSQDLGLISKEPLDSPMRIPTITMVDFTRNYSGEVSLKNHQHLLSKFVSTSLNPGLWMRNPWHDGQFDEHYFWLRRIKCQLAYSFLRQPWVTSQSVSLFLSKLKQNMKAKGGWFP